MRHWALVAAILAVLLAGCAAPAPDDPVGQENEVAWNQDIAVTTADGLNATERRAIVDRAIARIERVRGLEFSADVPVSVISRSQYLRNRSGGGGNETYHRWNDQVWEGLFVVGEDRSFHEVQNSTMGSQVLGYYSPSREEIVIVSDSETPTLSRGTLVHELVHALQDQQFGLDQDPETQDRQLASRSVTEGEANYVQRRYEERCNDGWSCVEVAAAGGSGSGNADQGVLLVILQPYVTGPTFVDTIRERGGWDAVNRLYDRFPDSTEQVLHPDRYPDDEPVDVTVPDRSGEQWRRFDLDPVADTLGEASVFAMFMHNGVLDRGTGRYSFQSPASEGWAGDALVPYRAGDRDGYVWRTVWDSEADAREFREAYGAVLDAHDAEARGSGVFVVAESDPFGDAFRVTRSGKTVTVVNAPGVDALEAVHRP
jgi:opacity protein-like surface antigen